MELQFVFKISSPLVILTNTYRYILEMQKYFLDPEPMRMSELININFWHVLESSIVIHEIMDTWCHHGSFKVTLSAKHMPATATRLRLEEFKLTTVVHHSTQWSTARTPLSICYQLKFMYPIPCKGNQADSMQRHRPCFPYRGEGGKGRGVLGG